ncbi:MAG: response regulator transcription factor, partial [Terriglobales bacterium]
WLNSQMYAVDKTASGNEGLELLGLSAYDLIILDLSLPDIDGLSVLDTYRNGGGRAPVLILTGRDQVADKEKGLDAGADDYLSKPFHTRELTARIRALLRRPALASSGKIVVGRLAIDPADCSFSRDGRKISLQPKEYALLELFMRNPDHCFSSDTILARVWQSDSETSPETIRVHIMKLRGKIDVEGTPSVIATTKGVGYKLDSANCD